MKRQTESARLRLVVNQQQQTMAMQAARIAEQLTELEGLRRAVSQASRIETEAKLLAVIATVLANLRR